MISFKCPMCEGQIPLDQFGKCKCGYGSVMEGYTEVIPQTIGQAIDDAMSEMRAHMDCLPPVGSDKYSPSLYDLVHRETVFLIERTLLRLKEEKKIDMNAYEVLSVELRKLYD